MQNNPHQEIRTDYMVSDVFTPTAANQLARSIPFDFVITSEMVVAYMLKHPGQTVLDIGALIASKIDGSDDATWDSPVQAPVRIFINVPYTPSIRFDFSGRLIRAMETGAPILDCSGFKVSGNWDATVTKDMVYVYSAYPYRVVIPVAGVNFVSTPATYVSFQYGNPANRGVIKVGAYATELDASVYGLAERDDIQIICEQVIQGHPYTISPSKGHVESGYRPALVMANWTSGAASTVLEYSLAREDTVKYGLYQQVEASIALGTKPVILENNTDFLARYTLSKQAATFFEFTNASLGHSIVLTAGGAIQRKGVVGTSTSGKVIITDLYPDTVPHVTKTQDGGRVSTGMYAPGSYDWQKLLIYREGTATMDTVATDIGHIGDTTWFYPAKPFDFKSAHTLDWYFWYAISDYEYAEGASEPTIGWYRNNRTGLYINSDTLREGTVYEVNMHNVRLPIGVGKIGTAESDYNVQISPIDRDDLEPLGYRPYVLFVDRPGVYSNIRYWGDTTLGGRASGSLPDGVYAAFYAPYTVNDYMEYASEADTLFNSPLCDLAVAKVQFVKLNGDIYIMSY